LPEQFLVLYKFTDCLFIQSDRADTISQIQKMQPHINGRFVPHDFQANLDGALALGCKPMGKAMFYLGENLRHRRTWSGMGWGPSPNFVPILYSGPPSNSPLPRPSSQDAFILYRRGSAEPFQVACS